MRWFSSRPFMIVASFGLWRISRDGNVARVSGSRHTRLTSITGHCSTARLGAGGPPGTVLGTRGATDRVTSPCAYRDNPEIWARAQKWPHRSRNWPRSWARAGWAGRCCRAGVIANCGGMARTSAVVSTSGRRGGVLGEEGWREEGGCGVRAAGWMRGSWMRMRS